MLLRVLGADGSQCAEYGLEAESRCDMLSHKVMLAGLNLFLDCWA